MKEADSLTHRPLNRLGAIQPIFENKGNSPLGVFLGNADQFATPAQADVQLLDSTGLRPHWINPGCHCPESSYTEAIDPE